MLIRVGHSADPDDAFMFWALAAGTVDPRGFEFEQVIDDIQTLNEWALEGRLEVTAISLRDVPARARPLRAAAARREHGLGLRPDRRRARAAVARRAPRDARSSMPGQADDRVPRPAARARRRRSRTACCRSTRSSTRSPTGARAAGLLIHEGQLTYARRRASRSASTSASGGCSRRACRCRSASTRVRRDLGDEAVREVSGVLARVDRRRARRTATRRSSTRSSSAAASTPSAATASSACT